MSLVASALRHEKGQSGLFRYAFQLLRALQKKDSLDLFFAHTYYPVNFNDTRHYLKKSNLEDRLSNALAWPLPRHIFGRGTQYLDMFYRMIHVDVDRVLYKDDMFVNADVYHSPFTPLSKNVKAYKGLARILTIHDLYPLMHASYTDTGPCSMKNLIDSIGDDYALCVSSNTKNDLLNYAGHLNPVNVFVAHLAASPETFYANKNEKHYAEAQKKYGLPEQYFLSLCTLEPRKNISYLIRSFLHFIREQRISDLYLVLVGAKGWDYDPIFQEIHEAGSFRDRIVVTGRIPDEDLATVYSHALAFFYMSLYEGFGLPPLEAMQCGVPTVTSNNSSLPEVVGDAGIMLQHDDQDSLCHAMYRLYSDAHLREEYSRKAIRQSQKFSWEKCADEHLAAYIRVM